ncbi:Vacuolar protein sorting-associated protein 74 [Saitoella coloradoensis]
MSTLTRRRGAGGPSADDSNSGTSTPTNQTPSDSASYRPPREEDVGHKIAFDPRDMDEGREASKQPKLTLMEEVLLMGLKDKQGYLSFWNDNISYTLRGCILIELALRGRIAMQKDPNRKRYALADRLIEVVDEKMTGEVLLDEALKMMKASEKMSVGSWVDLMSGETWNPMKIGYQLKQVRERLAKGLVDKGVLRTEKRNFLLFDMATHPVSDSAAKDEIRRRVINILSARTVLLPASAWLPENVEMRTVRTVAMVCAAYAGNVLENALMSMGHEARERAFGRVDELLGEFSQWPFGVRPGGGAGGVGANLAELVREEIGEDANGERELRLEVVAGVLQVYTRLDSIL